ncbi:triosephosphate isomerase [Candidatus Microgenomates bacterium]|nr:triosephosphate isomerase [Candidatus Microgenomates bacterium]
MERFLIVANWKANPAAIYNFQFTISNSLEIAIAPSYPLVSTIPEQFTRAAQDVSAFPIGAYTGEVPAKLLADAGVKYALIGHSERRKYLGETNQQVEAKMKAAIDTGLIPILCAQSLTEIPENIRNYPPGKFMLMYEPFSAISQGGQYRPETPEKIFATLTDWKSKLNLSCRFLYGGSVNPDNISELLTVNRELITGVVVGHASLDAALFSAIIKKCLLSLS